MTPLPMSDLSVVVAEVIRKVDYASFGVVVEADDGPPAENYLDEADAVLGAIFAPENREALRDELLRRGALAVVPDLWVWMGEDRYVEGVPFGGDQPRGRGYRGDYSEPSDPVFRFTTT